jgi:hypothetical protein
MMETGLCGKGIACAMAASVRSIRSVFAAICDHSRLFKYAIAALFFVFPLLGTPAAAQTTTISGTVYDPRTTGALPLSNVLVYVVPTGTVAPMLPSGAQCMTTSTPTPVVSFAYTDVKGTFTLGNVPINATYTLVIQAGKWRRQFSQGVTTTPITGLTLNMPADHTQGDIPFIAIATGQYDAMECVLREMGVADSEFTDDNGTTGGRIHLYLGLIVGNNLPGAEINSNTPLETALMTDPKFLDSYDMVMFPCRGGPYPQSNTTLTNLLNYANSGGRVFATHLKADLLDTDSPFNSPFSGVVNWNNIWTASPPDPTPNPGNATVITEFTDGVTLAQWLFNSGAKNINGDVVYGQVALNELRNDISSVIAPTQSWLTLNDTTAGNPVMQFTFNTPIGVAAANQCGQVLFNDYHIHQATAPSGTLFPAECPTSTMTPQEEILEYALFDQPTFITPVIVPNFSISFSSSPLIVDQGDTYDKLTVTVDNTQSTADIYSSVILTITLPPGLTPTGWTDATGGWICTLSTPNCTRTTNIAAGTTDSVTLTVSVTSVSNPQGTITATASSPNFFNNVTATDTVIFQQQPVITWPTPAPITYGTALSGTQLDATSPVAGSFTYSPIAGTVLTAGAQTLTATFTPTDTTDYTTSTASVTLQVNQATPTITWATPAAIIYGTPLSATQLNATSTVAGSFTYSPIAGTVLAAGAQPLTATFTPTDTTDYTTATASVTLQVNKATPTITWATPAPITYGTALSATQLNASSTVAGSFTYSPVAGTVLAAGAQPLTATFTPTDTADYTTAAASVTLTVNKATPTITWATPAAIIYGTPLSAAQLNASSTVAGSFTYSPIAGTVLTAGAQTLTATFTPTDTTDYTSATASVTLTVNKATSSITWATPAPITYGTPLSATQLDATSPVQGNFSYSPSTGTVLGIGPHTLTATFSPTDTTDYTASTATVSLTVNPAALLVALTASVNPVFTSNPLTYTATLTVLAAVPAAPTGTVTFYDGTTPLGSSDVTASVATFATTASAIGTHSITAVYSGDTNYSTATSLILSEIIQDFTLALSSGTAGTVTVPLGGQAAYPLVITPLGGVTLPSAVNLTLTGLPPGMNATFSTDVVAAGSSTANVMLQVFLPGQSAMQPSPDPFGGRSLPVALGLILLPLAGRLRKTARRFRRVALLALAGAALAVGLTGCQITFTPKSFPLTITATSGTLSHSTTVNIIVQ